jgi:hypothetical protein
LYAAAVYQRLRFRDVVIVAGFFFLFLVGFWFGVFGVFVLSAVAYSPSSRSQHWATSCMEKGTS